MLKYFSLEKQREMKLEPKKVQLSTYGMKTSLWKSELAVFCYKYGPLASWITL